MTKTEHRALQVVQGALEMLRNAIVNGDPHRELEFRARDLLAEVRAISDGNARTVATFKHTANKG